MSSSDLAGKVGVVTGGRQGIGRACVDALVAAGATVVVLDCGTGEAVPGAALTLAVDVTDADAIGAAFARIDSAFGRLDFAVNNAGIDIETEPAVEWRAEPLDLTLDVNLKGVYHCMRQELSLMRCQGGGSIVNIGSVAAIVGTPTRAAYAASKHGVVGLTRSAALEFGKDNVRTNVVCPGGTRTPLLEKVMTDNPMLREHIAATCPLGRLAEPSEIAEAVLWLASPKSSYVNGAVLPVDGGYTAG